MRYKKLIILNNLFIHCLCFTAVQHYINAGLLTMYCTTTCLTCGLSTSEMWQPAKLIGSQPTRKVVSLSLRRFAKHDIRPPPSSLQLCIGYVPHCMAALHGLKIIQKERDWVHDQLIAGHQMPRKRRKYTQPDQRIETIVSEYANWSKVELSERTGSQRWNELMNICCVCWTILFYVLQLWLFMLMNSWTALRSILWFYCIDFSG